MCFVQHHTSIVTQGDETEQNERMHTFSYSYRYHLLIEIQQYIFATNEINNAIDRGKLDTDFVQLTFNIVYKWKPQLEKSLFS